MAQGGGRKLAAALGCCVLIAALVQAWGTAPVTAAGRAAPSFRWSTTTLPVPAGAPPASFAEPGIVFGRGRTAIVSAAQANAGVPPTWWISRDDGRTWATGRDLDPTAAFTGDADAAIGPDGHLYVLNLGYADPPEEPFSPRVQVFASPDGKTWHGPAAFPPPHGTDQPDRPWLVADPRHPGSVFMFNSEGIGNVVVWRSADHARTFSGPTLVTGLEHVASLALTSRPLIDPVRRDRLYLLYATGALSDLAGVPSPQAGQPAREFPLPQLWLATSEDAGRTWTNHLALDVVEAFGPSARGGSLAHVLPALAIDRAGTLYSAFSLRLGTGTETHIYLTHSRDGGASWSAPARIDAPGTGSNVMPALVAGGPGRVALSWYGSASPDFTSEDAMWAEMFAQVVNAATDHPVIRRSRVSGARPVHTGGINAAGNLGSRLYDWSLRDFQSIAIDRCGMAHLVWGDDARGGSTVTARQIAGASLLPGRCAPATRSAARMGA